MIWYNNEREIIKSERKLILKKAYNRIPRVCFKIAPMIWDFKRSFKSEAVEVNVQIYYTQKDGDVGDFIKLLMQFRERLVGALLWYCVCGFLFV